MTLFYILNVLVASEFYFTNVAIECGLSFDRLPFMYDELDNNDDGSPSVLLKTVNTNHAKYEQGHLFARKISRDTQLNLAWMKTNHDKKHASEL